MRLPILRFSRTHSDQLSPPLVLLNTPINMLYGEKIQFTLQQEVAHSTLLSNPARPTSLPVVPLGTFTNMLERERIQFTRQQEVAHSTLLTNLARLTPLPVVPLGIFTNILQRETIQFALHLVHIHHCIQDGPVSRGPIRGTPKEICGGGDGPRQGVQEW